MAHPDANFENLEERLRSVESRLANLESSFSPAFQNQTFVKPDELQTPGLPFSSEVPGEDEKGLESRVGRVGLAWLGNFVLLFAIIFFTAYMIANGHQVLSVCLGALSAGAVFITADYLKKSNPNLSFILKINSQVILFYVALRMYFFSAEPLISNKFIVIFVLLLITSFQAYSAFRNKSEAFGFLTVTFAVITGILSDSTHLMLPLITLAGVLAVVYFIRFKWESLLTTSIFLVYAGYIMWLFGNPVMGHPMEILSVSKQGHYYLFALGGCFSALSLLRRDNDKYDALFIWTIILNGIFFTVLLTFISSKFFSENYVFVYSLISLSCLIYSVILKSVSDWKFAPAFYALYGFLAMSIALYGMVGLPRVYLLLSVQSLIVVSMALWFRNRLIIIMNSILFFCILLVYLVPQNPVDSVNFSFALVPLISARIINWQRTRLNIKTDLIRNLYLIEGFFMVLFALYHAMPTQFVALSWTVAALFYFLLSFILRNKKYRYMAIWTMICAAIYLFVIDLAKIEIIYRVFGLLFLSAVSIGISIYYNKGFREKQKH